jgi:hypothetical protein
VDDHFEGFHGNVCTQRAQTTESDAHVVLLQNLKRDAAQNSLEFYYAYDNQASNLQPNSELSTGPAG